MRSSGHEELTDPENEKILGTLTHEAWRGLAVEAVAASWYRLDTDLSYLLDLPNPLDTLIHEARQSSGSIKGDHRRDLKEAIIGSPAQSIGMSFPAVPQAPQEAPAPVKKRGL